MVTMPDWYVYDEGSEKGPFGLEATITYLYTKNPGRVFVWREGLEDWTRPRDVLELARNIPPDPPEPPLVAIREPEAPPELTEIRKKKYKFSWAGIGALVGLMICAADLLFEWRGAKFEEWDSASGLEYNFAYGGGSVALTAFIGFIIGAIRDALNGNSKQESAKLIESPLERNSRFNNIVARHWRGELPLWVSYWVFGFIGRIVIAIISVAIVTIFKLDKGYNPAPIFYANILIWLGIFLTAIWQMVGVWRSATRYTALRTRLGAKKPARRSTPLWAGLAKTAVILGFVQLLGTFGAQGLPELGELYKIAFYDDPDIPPYSIRIMRDGTEAEIVGGFKYGLTDDFAVVTKEARQVKVVHLDSVGGRLGEGEKLFKLIRERGLNTYVSSKCLSACTLAFAGGRERFLLKGATLGFHRGAFPGVGEGDFDSLQQQVFTAAGFASAFIERALSTPHKDMYRPSPEVLLAANVITSLADGTMFAASGLGANFTKDKAATSLAKAAPLFQTIQMRFPAQFSSMVDEYYEGILKGKTESETIETVRGRVLPFVVSLIPQADDDVLVDYNNILIDQYRFLNAKDPSICYSYAAGADPKANYAADLSHDLLQRELAVQERVVKTAAKRAQSSPGAVTPLLIKLRKGLMAKGFTEADFSLLESNTVERSKHLRYCSLHILFFREIGRLPPRESAIVLREIFASK